MRAPTRRVPITLFLAMLTTAGCNRSGEIPADKLKPRLYHRVVTLCIGINDYASPKMKDLSFAEPDATALAERLRTRYGYETVLLLGKDATRAAIGKKLREYKEQLGEKDVLIVYFAGHGQVIELPSHGRAGFLVPQDADLDLDDRSNVDAWEAQALEMRKLVDLLGAMRTHHVLLIADACCSGFMTKRGAFQERKDLHLLLSEPSRVVLAATTERQQAGEDWKTGHGFFTGALLDQLARRDSASVTDLFVEIRKQVSHDAKEMLPQIAKVGDGDGEFVFIPLEVPEHDIQVALRGGLDHALKGVYERTVRRGTQRTRLEDVLDAFNAVDYRFSTKPREREKVWQEKFERFEENAQISDDLAMVALHYCYAKGLGVEKNQEKAYRWAMRAYEAGHSAGRHALAHCYAEGIGVGKNKAAADALLRDSADFVLSRYCLHEEMLQKLISTPVGDKVPWNATVSLGADERTRLLGDLRAAAGAGVDAARSGLTYLSCYGIRGWSDLRLISSRKNLSDIPTVGKNLIIVAADRFDLRLLPSLNDVSGIPKEGKNLIVVATVNKVLHFRIFDRDAKLVVDTEEKKLAGQAKQIEELRKELESLWPPHELTFDDKGKVINAVRAIVGRTPAVCEVLHFRIFDADGRMVVDSDEKQLAGQAQQIEELRKELDREWPHHPFTKVLFVGRRQRVIDAVLSIVGYPGNVIIEASPKESLELLEAEAQRGSLLAHYYLAGIYDDGIPGVLKPDPEKLLLHGRAAAEAGLACAQSLLASAYLNAPGVPRDYAAARQWAGLADNQGNGFAASLLFDIHFHGEGVPRDFKKAAEYAERGEAAGNRRCIFYRGFLYWKGYYYPEDLDKALAFFQRAAQLGEVDAWLWAGRHYKSKYWDAERRHGPSGYYGAEALYCYVKAHYLGNKEAWQETRDIPGEDDYGARADYRIHQEEEQSAGPPPAP